MLGRPAACHIRRVEAVFGDVRALFRLSLLDAPRKSSLFAAVAQWHSLKIVHDHEHALGHARCPLRIAQNVVDVVLLHSDLEFLSLLVKLVTGLGKHGLEVAFAQVALPHYVKHFKLCLILELRFEVELGI